MQNPLVSERLELSVLYKEYAEDDNIYQQKIKVGAWPRGQEEPSGRGRSLAASDLHLAGPGLRGWWGSPLVAGSQVGGVWNQKDLDSDPDAATWQLCPQQLLRSQNCGDLSCEIGLTKARVPVRLRKTMPGGPGAGCKEPVLSVLTGRGLVGGGWLAGEGGDRGPSPAPCFCGEAGSTGERGPWTFVQGPAASPRK